MTGLSAKRDMYVNACHRTKLAFLWLLLLCHYPSFAQYRLHIQPVDKDSLFIMQKLAPPSAFPNRSACTDYIFKIPDLLLAKGFTTASVDSIHYDSAGASIRLYVG